MLSTVLYVEVNIVCAVLLAVIAANAASFGYDRSRRNKVFVATVSFVAVSTVMDSLWVIFEGTAVPHAVARLVELLYFVSIGCAAFFGFLYAQEIFERHWLRNNKRRACLYGMPLLALVLLLICSYFTGWVFSVDGNNVHRRGPLFFLQLLISGGYMLYVLVKALFLAAKPLNCIRRGDLLSVAGFSLPLLICSTLQLWRQEVPLVAAGATVSFLLLYIRTLKGMVSQDPVTGISDRRQLLLYLQSRIEGVHKNERLYFLFMDIDAFKEINDTYGHDEGDRVLRLVAGVLKDVAARSRGYCARYGGDEFGMVLTVQQESDIAAVTDAVYAQLQQRQAGSDLACPVDVSIGIAAYDTATAETVQEFVTRADRAMYVEKALKRTQR